MSKPNKPKVTSRSFSIRVKWVYYSGIVKWDCSKDSIFLT
jgi:hypothetical protein